MKLPRYVTAYKDRHLKTRYRYRRGGIDRHLPGNPGDPQFKEALKAAREAEPVKADRHAYGTVDWLLTEYYRSNAFNRPSDARKKVARGILEAFRRDYGKDLVANIRWDHVEAILQSKARKRVEGKREVGGIEAARALHKQLRRLFAHGVKLGLIQVNPAEQADTIRQKKGEGRHAWTEAEIATFYARWPIGTKARLAMEIMLWTGQRRGDAARFGPEHIKGGKVEFVAAKGQKPMKLPVAPQLVAAIKAMPSVGIKTFLVTEWGKPFAVAGFGNWFADRCNDAGLYHCRAHGLRKAFARRAAELGATQAMLKAMGGWEQDAEVATYTKKADQERLAGEALGRVIAWDSGGNGQ